MAADIAWESLPDGVWELIMNCVSFRQRHLSCSRVSTKIHRAAAAVTCLEVDCSHDPARTASLKQWLSAHGDKMSILQLSGLCSRLIWLPCQQLVQLDLTGCDIEVNPGLTALTALTKLSFDSVEVLDLAFRLPCSTLRHLHLHEVSIKPSGLASLLTLIGQQTQLQELCIGVDGLETKWPSTAAAYTALTASSSLQRLELLDVRIPEGAFKAAVAAPLALHQLTVLILTPGDDACDGKDSGLMTGLNAADTKRLASCCPNLQYLKFRGISSECLPEDELYWPLAQLSHLTYLELTGLVSHHCCKSLAAITSLKELVDLSISIPADDPHEYDMRHVLPLTALQQLTVLDLYLMGQMGDGEWQLEAGPNKPPVWQQLLKECEDGARWAAKAAAEVYESEELLDVVDPMYEEHSGTNSDSDGYRDGW